MDNLNTIPTNTPKQSSKLLLLLLGLVIVLVVAGLIELFRPKKFDVNTLLPASPSIVAPTAQTSPSPRILTTGEVHLSLVPQPATVRVGQQFVLSVVVDPGIFGVSGVETHFSYNPAQIKILKIEPGVYFKTPDILINNNDAKTGSFDYAIASRTRSTGSGTVYKLQVQAVGVTNGSENPIQFKEKETKVGLSSTTKNERLGEAQTKVILDEQPFTITK